MFSSNVYAQDEIGTSTPKATITLKQGATIFSTDPSFNQQINSDKITVKNADVSNAGLLNDAQVLTAKPNKAYEADAAKKDFKTEFKKAEEKKKKEDLKKIKKAVTDHEKKNKSSRSENLRVFPSSEQFIATSHINRDYVSPNYNNHYFSKIHNSQDQYLVKHALDFLHQQKYTYYNSRSLDYCFTHVFSVRPPPVLG